MVRRSGKKKKKMDSGAAAFLARFWPILAPGWVRAEVRILGQRIGLGLRRCLHPLRSPQTSEQPDPCKIYPTA